MGLSFSRTLAIIFGAALPLLAIVRHWTSAEGDATGLFVDLVNGGFLLYGAWKVNEAKHSGQRYLAAAWGLTVGLLYVNLASQIAFVRKEGVVSSPIPQEVGLVAASIAMLLALLGLISSLRSIRKH